MEDDGCKKATNYLGRKSSCLECPFYPDYDDCIEHIAIHIFESWIRSKRAKEWTDSGHTVQEIAEWLDVSRGTVNRYLRKENAQKARGEIKKAG